MATAAQQPRSTGASSLEAGLERLIEPALYVVAGVLALATVAPLLVVAAPVWLGLAGLRTRSWRVKGPALASCLAPALVALLVAYAAHGSDPIDAVVGYVNVQVDAGIALARDGLGAFQWAPYLLAVWPYALGGGSMLGGVSFVLSGCFGQREQNELRAVSADELGRFEGKAEPQPVDGFAGRGRLTALTALPKQGKTFAWFGLLKARQTGGTWFGRMVLPGKTLVMTEEDRGTFAGKVKRFGITGAALVSVHAPEAPDRRFGPEAWPGLVDDAARLARRKGCDTLTVDTLTTWAPWAFRGPEAMSLCLRTLKAACGRYKLAGVVILHNRKQQTDLGAVVDMLGTIAGSAAYDVIAGFKREKDSGECTLAVDGRLGEWECTAVLKDGRYVPVSTDSQQPPPAAPAQPSPPPVPAHLRTTLAHLVAHPAGLTTDELLDRDGGSKPALIARLSELRRSKLVTRRGHGVRGDPHVWTPAPTPQTATGRRDAVRDDPAYVAYLKSPEWAAKRTAALASHAGHCQRCPSPAVEVHHLTYERVCHELPEDLIALCAPCHRRAHPA